MKLPIDTEGKRPAFFDDPAVDALMTALLETMAENWTLRERLQALEKLLVSNGVIKADAIETVEWTAEEQMALFQKQQAFLTDAFRGVGAAYQPRADRKAEVDRPD